MSEPLAIERLALHRSPGIPRPGFVLDELGPGINVIHGPNASGKTSTARAIRALLWPDAEPIAGEIAAEADLAIGDAAWRFELEAGRRRCAQGGVEAEAPALPPAEAADRYTLALPDLLAADGSAFARAILRESSGGYDIRAAAERLGFRERVKRPKGLIDRMEGARERLRQARDQEKELQAELEKLEDLRARHARAQEAARRVDVLERARMQQDAAERVRELREQRDAYPAAVTRLSGEERKRAEALEKRAAEQQEKRDRAQRAIAEQERSRAEIGLADALESHGEPDVADARERVGRLEKLEESIADAERRGAEERATRDRQRALLGESVSDEQLAAIDAPTVGELDAFAARAERVRADRLAYDRLSAWLGTEQEHAVPETLREGVAALERWLETAGPPRGARLRRVAAGALAALAVGCGLALAVLHHPIWGAAVALSLAAAGALAAAEWRASDPRERAGHARAFQRTGLHGPTRWQHEDVQRRLGQLRRELASAEMEAERGRRYRDLLEPMRALEQEEKRVAAERAEKAGPLAPLLNDGENGAYSLAFVGNALARWQEAHNQILRLERNVSTMRSQHAATAGALAQRVEPYGEKRPADAAEAKAGVERLATRVERDREARRKRQEAIRERDEAQAELERIAGERAELYEPLGLEPGDEAGLDALLAQREPYEALAQQLRDAEHDRDRAAERLAAHPETDPGLAEKPREELERALEAARETAEQERSLADEIARLEERARASREKHDVERALAERDRAAWSLAEAADREKDALVGHALAAWLQARVRERHRPPVFHRARELFGTFTAGRYRLALEERAGAGFRAHDTAIGREQPIEELSSGTRLQLLVAVRLAFVEAQETAAAPPLILDEALATSDDERADAMIATACALARAGRQVLVFTAQRDELAKWRRATDAEPPAPRRIDLARVRAGAAGHIDPPELPKPEAPAVPDPGELDHTAYGARLGVEPIDPAAPVSAAPLWYVIHDPQALAALHRRGVARWGQLETLLETADPPFAAVEPGTTRAARARAEALRAILADHAVGRSRPLDPETLEAAPGVTANNREAVRAAAEAVGWDPERLLAEIADRVDNWGRKKTQRLREWLLEQGFLDDAEPIAPDQMRLRAIAAVRGTIDEGTIGPETVDWLIGVVGAGR